MKYTISSITLILLVVFGLTSCTKQQEKKVEKIYEVEIMEAAYSNPQESSRYSGKVSSINKTLLSTKVMGQIEYIPESGTRVKKGDVLIRIRSEELSSQLISTKALLERASATQSNTLKNYDRISRLYEKGSATQRELDDISTQLKVDEAQVVSVKQSIRELNEMMSYSRITAPIDGYISEKFANISDMTNPGQPLLALESMEKMEIQIRVPEFEIGQLTVGMPIKVEFPSLGEKPIQTTISRIVQSTEFSGSQFIAMAGLPANNSFKPGMFARISIPKGNNEKIIIPREVIHSRGQLQGIYTINQQGESMLRWIRLGKTYPNGVEVLSGLSLGEQIIVTFDGKPKNGVKVEIKNKKAS